VNIELLLRQYLYQHKYVTYPGIGKLELGTSGSLPATADKAEPFLLQDLQFKFNLNEDLDPDFIAFVSVQTGKIKPLATADVESFFMLSKQFLHIGKAFVVEGIGSVEKQDNGVFAFTPGFYVAVSEASAAPHKPLKIREAQPVIPKAEVKTKKSSPPVSVNKNLILGVLGVIGLLVVGWAVYYFIFASKNNNNVIPVTADSIQVSKDTVAANATKAITPQLIGGFKAIVDTRFTRVAANTRAAKLRTFGHNAQVDSAAPNNFRIYIPVTDTIKAIDSLKLNSITGKRPKFEVQ